jgi:hypothetical protein
MLTYKQLTEITQRFSNTVEELNEKKNVMDSENDAIDDVNSQITKARGNKSHIVVHHNGVEHHITHAEKITGTPKADFKLSDKKGNHIFLSHKAGSTVKDFQQYGGTTEHGDHPAVKKLVKHIQDNHGGDGKSMPGTVANKLNRKDPEDNHLLHKSVFGNDYGSAKKGINNVHAIVQGKVELHKHPSGHFEIGAHHVYHNGELPEHIQGMVTARYMGGRKNHGLNNIRTGVLPVGSRAVTKHN